MKYDVRVTVKATLVKRFTIKADCAEDATFAAERLAGHDVDKGSLRGWDMTTDSEVASSEIEECHG